MIHDEIIARLDGPLRKAIFHAYDVDRKSFNKLRLSSKPRQQMQRWGLIDKPDFHGYSFIMDHSCDLNSHGKEVALCLVDAHREYCNRKEQMCLSNEQYKRDLKTEGVWDDLVMHHPFLGRSLTDCGDKRLIEIYRILGGRDIALGGNPLVSPSKLSRIELNAKEDP